MGCACFAAALISIGKLNKEGLLHRKRQIDLNCAINCGIRGNDSNKKPYQIKKSTLC